MTSSFFFYFSSPLKVATEAKRWFLMDPRNAQTTKSQFLTCPSEMTMKQRVIRRFRTPFSQKAPIDQDLPLFYKLYLKSKYSHLWLPKQRKKSLRGQRPL